MEEEPSHSFECDGSFSVRITAYISNFLLTIITIAVYFKIVSCYLKAWNRVFYFVAYLMEGTSAKRNLFVAFEADSVVSVLTIVKLVYSIFFSR